MIEEIKILEALKAAFPDAASKNRIVVRDTAGDMMHYAVEIASSHFVGIPIIEQHRKVKQALTKYLKSGELHAVTIKTEVL